VGKATIKIVECAIELGFEAFLEDGTEIGTGLHPSLDEVSPKYDTLGGGILHSKFLGSVKEPFPLGKFSRLGWTTGHVGFGDTDETVDADNLASQPADGGVACIVLIKSTWSQMTADERNDFFGQVFLIGHSLQEGPSGVFSLGFVLGRPNAGVFIGSGGERFAQIVTQDAKTDYEVFPFVVDSFFGKGIHAVQGVDPYVSLWMPFGILMAID